jgi:hypothetical protein
VHQAVKNHEKGHLACVDFKDSAGKAYDVDVVVGKKAVSQVFLHKVDGAPVTK